MKKVNSELLGIKVLGNWGSAGFTYGVITDVLTDHNEVLVTWEENEDGLTESYYELKDIVFVNDEVSFDKVGVYLLPERV